MKKILTLIVALSMVLSLGAGISMAEENSASDPYEALSLEDAQWTLDESNGAWTLSGISYCLNPVEGKEIMNIYVPEAYMNEDGSLTETVVNGYNALTAPVIYVVDMGGYDEAKAANVGKVSTYLKNGYVVATPGSRGKTTTDAEGNFVGRGAAAPADLKAGIRFLKYNDEFLAGKSDMIVVTGTSAGGAMASLIAASGNNDFFDPYLEEIGAIMTETDDVYAAQCYCPATNQENTDMLYEWLYAGQYTDGENGFTEFQTALSDDLAAAYIEYVNAFGFEDAEGNVLTLDGLREGTYYDAVLSLIGDSIAYYINSNYSKSSGGMSAYTYLDEEAVQAFVDELNQGEEWVKLEYSYAKASTGPSTIVTYAESASCTITDLESFTSHCLNRNDTCPSSDTFEKSSPANQIYGTETEDTVHYSMPVANLISDEKYASLEGYDASIVESYKDAANNQEAVYALNPLNFIEDSDVAPYIRLRAGTADDRVAPIVCANVGWALMAKTDSSVNLALAWGQPHGEAEAASGDLVNWIERICKFEAVKTDDEIASLLNLDNMEYTWSQSGDCYILNTICDVANPELKNYQTMSVAIPAYYVKEVAADGSLVFDYDYEYTNVNGTVYTAATAPVIINTGAAGYSADTAKKATSTYVSQGYINVACGNRGKSLSATDASGNTYYCGDAPYCLVDQKACVRWVKYNIYLGNLCGSADRIVSTGGSGGGAHSLMLAATGNHSDFYPYLEESGAVMRYTDDEGNVVEISDAIWGCCPYSAITNLEEADIAYEFEGGLAKNDSIISRYSEFRQLLSNGEALEYMEYINGRGLTYDIDGDGVREELTIEYDEANDSWSGTYIELMEQVAEDQLEWYVNNIPDDEYTWVYSFEGETNGVAYLRGDYEGGGSSGESGGGEGAGDTPKDEGPDGAGDSEGGEGAGEKAADNGDSAGEKADDGDSDGGKGTGESAGEKAADDGDSAGEKADDGDSADGKGTGESAGSEGPKDDAESEMPEANAGYASEADDSVKTGSGEDLTTWVTYEIDEDGYITVDFDIADFMVYRGRSKTNPAFDDLDLGQAENQEFGDHYSDYKHWDIFVLNVFDKFYDQLDAAYDGSDASAESFAELYEAYKTDIESMQAGDKFGNNIVYLYNPLNYILDEETEMPTWMHICHGSADTDSSVLISMNDGVAFDMRGVVGHFGWSWDDPHVAGDPVGTTMEEFIDSMVEAGY